ncbi:MAG: hypothetical protein AAGA65_26450 [Actinomycetota bacterium]
MVTLAAMFAVPVSAHRSSGWVPVGQNKIFNWDYRSTSSTALSNADWPINVIFWNNSSIEEIEDQRHDIFAYNCNVLWLCDQNHRSFQANPVYGDGWDWDTQGGRKEFRCGWLGGPADVWALHYRAYENEEGWSAHAGLGQMPLWDPGWGYFTPTSSHFDIDDPGLPVGACDATAHGYDETAEGWMVGHFDAIPGWQGVNDWTVHFHNDPASLRVIGGIDHWGNGNGSTSIIYVP